MATVTKGKKRSAPAASIRKTAPKTAPKTASKTASKPAPKPAPKNGSGKKAPAKPAAKKRAAPPPPAKPAADAKKRKTAPKAPGAPRRVRRLNAREYEAIPDDAKKSSKTKLVYPGKEKTWTLQDFYKYHADTPVLDTALRSDLVLFVNTLMETLEDTGALGGNADAIKFLGLETSKNRREAFEELLSCDPAEAPLPALRTKLLDRHVNRLLDEAGVKNANVEAKEYYRLLYECISARACTLVFNNLKFDGRAKTVNMAHVLAMEDELRGEAALSNLPIAPELLKRPKKAAPEAAENGNE